MANSNASARRAVGLVAAALTLLATYSAGVWRASADRAVTGEHLETHAAALADHEARLRAVEASLAEIAVDIRWVRTALESRGADP